MIAPYPRLQVDVAEQLACFAATHAPSPNLVGANESRSTIGGERRFNGLLERERSDMIDTFKKAIRSSAEVVKGFYLTVDADFVLYLTARTMEDHEQFTRRSFYENSDIKGFKTMVIMNRVKTGFAIPISSPAED